MQKDSWHTGEYASALKRVRGIACTLLLVCAMIMPCAGAPIAQRALASGSSVTLWKVGNIEYTDGAWNTHIFKVNDGEGEATAYCVEPAKNSPPEGQYAKAAFSIPTGREYELRTGLWFGYGGPGFDASMWPATNWNGVPMSDDDYYLATHILLSDAYCSNLYEACYGAGDNFRYWIEWNVTGLDMDNGSVVNEGAFGRVALRHSGEIPPNFETYLIDGGSRQTIAASSAYHPYGTIKMNKRSANPGITDGNPIYTMEGITYGIYTDRNCDAASDTGRALVLDESGYAQVDEIRMGTYFIREEASSVAGTGYAHDPTVYSCQVAGGQVSWLHDTANAAGDVDQNDITDTPIASRAEVLIQKHDLLTKSSVPSGDADMAGALFEVRYFANTGGATSGSATRTWKFVTNGEGQVDLRDSGCFVSGDALYRNPDTGEALFPLGTYSIRELSAPGSYEPPSDAKPQTLVVTASGTGEYDISCEELAHGGLIVEETPIRHDLSFAKRDMDTQRPMRDIPFMVSRIADDGSLIERHVIVTDANGMFDSSTARAFHTTRTNANDAAVTVRGDGSYLVDESRLDNGAGTWFGTAKDGSWIAPDNSFGAFPDSVTGKYVFEELPVQANVNKALVRFEAYAHAAQSRTIDLGTVGNTTPPLATTARDAADGDKLVSRDTDARIVDSIAYSGLVAGQTYTLEGYLVNAASGEKLCDREGNAISSSLTFIATASSGNIELGFDFDAARMEDGACVVVCEQLFEKGRLLAQHESLDDSSQTVTIVQPTIATSAMDELDGDSLLTGDVDTTIIDRVTYTGLTPGANYELTGIVMDYASGQPFQGPDGLVTSTISFNPEAPSGSIDMRFTLDACELEPGTKLVVFERLARDGVLVASHEDLNDAGQTVSVFPPALQTCAADSQDGDSCVAADLHAHVVDTVSYKGLRAGREYTLEATLVDKRTGQPILDPFDRPVTATHLFTPIEQSGSTDVIFDFDASNITTSTATVVFEELYRDGRYLASHIDLNSADQSIVIEPPIIQTGASSDGISKQVMRDRDVTIIDEVSYHNLKAGQSYELAGSVMDKATGKQLLDRNESPIESSLAFTPDTNSGLVELSFTLDTTVVDEGSELVVFEKLYRDGVEIASHEDIESMRQTVTVTKPSISTTATSEDGAKSIVRDVDAMIVDTVSYRGLAPECTYELIGRVMDRTSGQALVDANGQEVIAQTDFIAEHADGNTTLSFAFDASLLEDGHELVVFERLYRDDEEIAAHEDIDDEEQTVSVIPPAIETFASDTLDGDKIVAAHEETRILDAVSYEGLKPGATYEFVGTLMDKKAESPLLTAQGQTIQATRSFTPNQPSGTVDVTFSFDASNSSEEQEVVIFEELYRDGKLIATHADYENTAQAVNLAPPHIKTSASDAADDDKDVEGDGPATIIDTVSFTGLIVGESYELDGALMIDDGTIEGIPARDAFGNPITAHLAFTPEASHGSVDISFEVDTTLLEDDTKLVAFERLFADDTLMAEHADIHDENQTVTVKPTIPVTPPDAPESKLLGFLPKTGDSTAWMLLACCLIGSATFGLLAFLQRKASGEMREQK